MKAPSTKNFNIKTDPKIGCTCGDERCTKPTLTQRALDRAQGMREDLNQPMVINSGARCHFHPNEAHRAAGTGDHQKCETIDFKCNDEALETKIKVLAGRYGATRVAGGAYCGFVHCCFGETERTDVPTWSYK